jgi:3-oxoacyl-[acyl-carrier-protein] synthase III
MALADTATPYQTCPSEAQRIIGEFGVKLPAYDSVGGAAALLQALSTIGAWNQERIPEYLLYVSTNTPSQQVSYCAKSLHGKSPHSCAATVIGDAAVALLLSTKHTGKARILSTRMSPEPIRRMPFRVEQSIAFNPELLAGEREVTDFIRSELGEALEINPAKVLVVPPPLYTRECATTLLGLGIGEDRLVSGVDQVGYSFGASLGVGLVRALERAKSGDQIVLLHCGDGLRGSVVLGVE